MPGKASFDYFMEQARLAPNWKNELTLRSMDLYRGMDNATFVPWISPTPLLMIVALGDEVTPPDFRSMPTAERGSRRGCFSWREITSPLFAGFHPCCQ